VSYILICCNGQPGTKAQSVCHCQSFFLRKARHINHVRIGLKCMRVTNTLAYFKVEQVRRKKFGKIARYIFSLWFFPSLGATNHKRHLIFGCFDKHKTIFGFYAWGGIHQTYYDHLTMVLKIGGMPQLQRTGWESHNYFGYKAFLIKSLA